MQSEINRRGLLAIASGTVVALSLPLAASSEEHASKKKKDENEKEVEAAEDLMREHGVLRRALFVYEEAAERLTKGMNVSTQVLRDTATLFRHFGEDYHERELEEQRIFPVVAKKGGKLSALTETLHTQHDRGRQITDYVLATARGSRIDGAQVNPLSETLKEFVRMYNYHTAIEDTVLFPAWKEALTGAQYHEISDQFEDIEHRMFGKDGFEDAVERIAKIESAFGIGDLSQLTAPVPPKSA